MAVNLIDPNNVNINQNIVNGIPQYQDMYIFAELTAVRKGRTVLVGIGDLNNAKYTVEETGLEKTIKVNFLGNNQNINSPNYLKFTTNYYGGSNTGNIQHEGFGISNIKVVINASFVPQVNIQFVDIRGLAFFNQQKSPYRMLFDFPPPIFKLTIKGYYGRALSYELHLVKYTSEFKAENGNFIIDAQFVAMTFAPLSDVLLRYVINFPLIDHKESIIPQTGIAPQNTFELITKLKNLYSTVLTRIKSDSETTKHDNIMKEIVIIDTAISVLNDYNNVEGNLRKYGQPYLILLDNSENPPNIRILDKLNAYDSYITAVPYSENIIQRLFIGYSKNNLLKSDMITPTPNSILHPPTIVYGDRNVKYAENALIDYTATLLTSAGALTTPNSISKPQNFSNVLATTDPNYDEYFGIDVTKYYVQLYRNKFEKNELLKTISTSINTKINNFITEELGMMPSIYNVFKIILDDVDKFFSKLRKTSMDAENDHNLPDLKSLILNQGQYGDITVNNNKTHIFAFPLVIDKEPISGGFREIRIAPIDISKKLELVSKPFPEISLVNEFIKTFFLQKNYNALINSRGITNPDGTLKWIPISVIDSQLISPNANNPYIGVLGGAKKDSKADLVQIFDIMLKRFYILSQSTYPKSFYGVHSKLFVDLFANSEAINLVSSLNDPDQKYFGLLKTAAIKYKGDIEQFYKDLNTSAYDDYYNFEEKNNEFFPIFDDDSTNENGDAYVDKTNPDYIGVQLNSLSINPHTLDEKSDNLIDKYLVANKGSGLIGWWTRDKVLINSFGFTTQNLMYFKDESPANNTKDTLDISLQTRFLSNVNYVMNKTSNSIYLYTGNNNKIETIEKLLISGNSYFSKITSLPRDILNHRFYNIIDVWVDQLSKHDNDIANDIINSKSKLGALLYLSNFGYTLSPFNKYPNNLNETMFNLSAEINIPMYLPAYIGALVYAIESGDTNFTEQKIKDFFTIGAGKTLDSSGVFIFADIYDIKNYLSKKDKETFKTAFDEFYSHTSQSVNFLYDNIFAEIQKLYNNIKDKTSIEKEKLYRSYLKPDNNEYYSNIIQPLIQRTNILNLSEITFDMNPVVPTHIGYQSLKSLNDKTNLKNINTNYFTQFFSKLLVEITTEENRIKELKKEQEKSGNDKDIVTETYYSFKNINDKWLSSPNYTNIEGYPFNEPNKSLINSFVFVDRAMNPIGDTILNAECLIDMFDDPNVSVFTALSQLLSLNGFEFFPLQNFMSYGEGAWRDTFKIDTSGNIKSSPAYVCMYIGGTSSYPSTGGNGFINDGIIDLSTADSKDFNTVKPNKNALSDDENAYPEFPFRQVRAFKVRFGEQNQSMFTDIKIESKEYPDTNESIQILSRLAGDNNNVPVPKGQNLYNLYENRAYRATITGLGNAMIQPTQYFQLENVPIFNGAYIILSVEHTIEPNKMMTNFSGTKILRYPVPRVVDAASIYGFEGSSAGDVVSHVTPGTTGTGTEAITISQPRLEKLKSVFGIDVSYAQINLNWNKYKGDSTDPGFPNPKFVLIKVSQGDFVDPVRIKNINGAKSINLKIGYYHYAEQYADSNVSANIVANATAQAQFFINTVKALPVPNFPLILDMEDREEKNKYWSKIKDNNDLWIDTFITELKKNGYNTILYANHNFITNKMNGNKFASIPLWHARYLLPPLSPESYNPNPSNGWKDWTIWQFSSSNNHLDLNIMKESFFESAKPYLNST